MSVEKSYLEITLFLINLSLKKGLKIPFVCLFRQFLSSFAKLMLMQSRTEVFNIAKQLNISLLLIS